MCTLRKRSNALVASRVRWKEAAHAAVLLAACLTFEGCGAWSSKSSPEITFTNVPPADDGGLDVLKTLSGRVVGARSGQHIVLYAKSEGRWWMQPSDPSAAGDAATHSEWKGQTHPGAEYGALLADSGFTPPLNMERMPGVGGPIAAVATVRGVGSHSDSTPAKLLQFSGYDWTVRSAPSHRGGSRNVFDPANAWVDSGGALHLKIAREGDHWTCSEVQLNQSLGYGTYSFVVRDTSHMDLSAVLTMFTWDGGGPEENRHEISYEISHWGNPEDTTNTTMLIQPYYIPTNGVRFQAPKGEMTDEFRWEPSQATFTSYAGIHSRGAGARVLQKHVFTSGIPAAGGDAARINLYVFAKGQVPLQHENEIVIEKFEYFP